MKKGFSSLQTNNSNLKIVNSGHLQESVRKIKQVHCEVKKGFSRRHANNSNLKTVNFGHFQVSVRKIQ